MPITTSDTLEDGGSNYTSFSSPCYFSEQQTLRSCWNSRGRFHQQSLHGLGSVSLSQLASLDPLLNALVCWGFLVRSLRSNSLPNPLLSGIIFVSIFHGKHPQPLADPISLCNGTTWYPYRHRRRHSCRRCELAQATYRPSS